jgi:hypothetical protein
MEYILIDFTLGLECQAYQEILNGEVVRYCDLNGVTLELPAVTESHVVNANPDKPEWAE